MDDQQFLEYLGRIQDAKTPAQLVAIRHELVQLPSCRERDTFTRTVRRMLIRAEN